MHLIPQEFEVPGPPVVEGCRLEPLDERHNERDFAAWTGSIEFIRALPGWLGSSWPTPMSLDENRRDLRRHAAGFAARGQFCYTVLDEATGDVVGCVYVNPTRPARDGATEVRSWVVADRADLDKPLYDAVSAWLAAEWPFAEIEYAER